MMKERKKFYFIYNPVAGKGKVRAALPGILYVFGKAGFDVTCHPTFGAGEAQELAMNYDPKRYKCLVVAGGDGTLDEVVRGLMKSFDGVLPTIGYIPVGTANDFAASHKLPKNPVKAAEVIIRGKTDTFDLGMVGEDLCFSYIAAFGNFIHLSYDTPQKLKNALGHAAYLIKGLPEFLTFFKMKPYHLKVTAPGGISYEGDYAAGMIANAKSIAGFTGSLSRGVDLQDGLFEVTLIKAPKTVGDVMYMINRLIVGNLDNKFFDYFVAPKVTIESDPPMDYSIDGEFGGKRTHVESRILERKLRLRVPE